jgi:hypothetical protein
MYFSRDLPVLHVVEEPMLSIDLCFENSPEDLRAAAAVIAALRDDDLLGDDGGPVPVPLAPAPPPNAPAGAWNISPWFNRLGPGSRQFWIVAAQFALTHRAWTFDDLAAASGLDKGTLRSYQRNSYRAIRAEQAPEPLGGDWDPNRQCNVYTMADVVRDEILRLSGQMP